jgi:bla regulator protein blaR1
MGAMKNEIFTACYQFVAAMLNGTYQGILITVFIAATLGVLRRTNATTRCAVWFATLLLLALLIPAHYLRSRWEVHSRSVPIKTSLAAPVSQSEADVLLTDANSLPPESDDQSDYLAAHTDFSKEHSAADPEENNDQRDPDSVVEERNSARTSEDPVHALVVAIREANASQQLEATYETKSGILATLKEKLTRLGERLLTPLPSWKIAPSTPFLLALLFPVTWLTIAAAKIGMLIWDLARIRKLKLNSAEPKPELNALFLSLRENLGVRRNVALRVSLEQRSPVVLGFFKPMILLPSDADLETEPVLRHELAHVRRRDDWANLVQHFIKALFFFHPAIWWVSKRISLEREIACDDQVLESTRRPKAYALLLANLAGRMQPSVLAPGVSTNQSQLEQRIDMILNTNRNTSPRLAKVRLGLLGTAAALVAASAIYVAPRLAFAQSAITAPAAGLAPDAPGATSSAAPTTEIAASEDIAPAPAAGLPSGLPATPPVPTGPKFKPGSEISVDVRPAIVPHPSIAIVTAPTAGVPPAPMTLLTPPVPVAPMIASAGQPETPRPARRPGRDSSLEDRLDRLEKMVESLVAQQKGKPGSFNFTPKAPAADMKFNWKNSADMKDWERAQADYAKKMAEFEMKRADMDKHLAELEKQKLNDPKIQEKFKELSEQHARMALDQEKMAKEAQRAARDAQRGRTMHKMRDGSRQELEALHRQHEALERQMQQLDHQIEKLEREQEQLDERQESDNQNLDAQQNSSEQENRLDALYAQLNELLTKHTEKHPAVQTTRTQIRELQKQLASLSPVMNSAANPQTIGMLPPGQPAAK